MYSFEDINFNETDFVHVEILFTQLKMTLLKLFLINCEDSSFKSKMINAFSAT